MKMHRWIICILGFSTLIRFKNNKRNQKCCWCAKCKVICQNHYECILKWPVLPFPWNVHLPKFTKTLHKACWIGLWLRCWCFISTASCLWLEVLPWGRHHLHEWKWTTEESISREPYRSTLSIYYASSQRQSTSLLAESFVTQCPQSAQVSWGQSIQCHCTKAMKWTKWQCADSSTTWGFQESSKDTFVWPLTCSTQQHTEM